MNIPPKRGRPKGVPNKTTTQSRKLFNLILRHQVAHVEEALDEVRKANPVKYLEILSKFITYFIPKQADDISKKESISRQVFKIGDTIVEL